MSTWQPTDLDAAYNKALDEIRGHASGEPGIVLTLPGCRCLAGADQTAGVAVRRVFRSAGWSTDAVQAELAQHLGAHLVVAS